MSYLNNLVWCQLPKAGLGNQLFPLMKAYVYAHRHQLPIMVTGYHQVKLGPYLRGEKSKRNYRNAFKFQKSIWDACVDEVKLRSLMRNHTLIHEPSLQAKVADAEDHIYVFGKIPHWSHYFKELSEQRELVSRLFWEAVDDDVKDQAARLAPPCIGVHIRMGDFRTLTLREEFKNVGTVRTPLTYFAEVIQSIRNLHGTDLPVSIFTDGFRNELGQILDLKHVTLQEGNTDVVDMLLLSRSKVIVTSAGSTFGYWAGFLSDAPLILHPDHIHQPIRGIGQNDFLYEGRLDMANKNLQDAIRKIV